MSMEAIDLQGYDGAPPITVRYEKSYDLQLLANQVREAITEAADAGFIKVTLLPMVVHAYEHPDYGKAAHYYIQPIIVW